MRLPDEVYGWTRRGPEIERKEAVELPGGLHVAALESFLLDAEGTPAQLAVVDAVAVRGRVALGIHRERDRRKAVVHEHATRWYVVLNALRNARFDVPSPEDAPRRVQL